VSSRRPATVGVLLRDATERLRASGSESARLDAELLLGHVMRVDRASLLASSDVSVGADHVSRFEDFVARRQQGEPVAYIRGLKEFYGLAISVDGRALIPRPETELLVEIGMARLRYMLTERLRPRGGEPLLVWDVGTGSGAICVSLAVEARRRRYERDVRFRATDSSVETIELAVVNAVSHGVADLVDFAVADLAELSGASAADILLANLPYVPSATVPKLPIAASFEPVQALDGGPDGLDVIRRLLTQLEDAVAPTGIALLEIGAGQADALRDAARDSVPDWTVSFHDDLSGVPRVAELTRGDK
jgi:release factor glutamine methyltransferase